MTFPEPIMRTARLIADRWADDENTEECAEAIAGAILAERERCAKIADEHLARVPNHNPDAKMADLVAQGYGNAALNIGIAIDPRRERLSK